jgi:hypothetical protein
MNVDEVLEPADDERLEDLIESGNDADVSVSYPSAKLSGVHISDP